MAQTPPSQHIDNYGYPTRPDSRHKVRKLVVRTCKQILLAGIYVCASGIGLLLMLSRLAKKQVSLSPETFHPKRILVLRMDLIGDLVLSLPIVRALKRTYPDAEIDLLAIPSSFQVVTSDPDLAEVIAYDPNIWRRPQALFKMQNWRDIWALRDHLQTRHYDLALSVFGPWAAIFAVLSGARRRVGFGQESYPGFMTDNVAGAHWQSGDHLHEVDYCLQLAQAAGATIESGDRTPQLYVDIKAQQEIDHILLQGGIALDKPILACHVSSNNGQAKRWPIPYWVKLIDELISEDHMTVVLTGATNDLPFIETILRRTREQPVNLAGKTSLTQLAALLKRAGMLITGDSGPMHIVAAVGTPLIAIHGPTNPVMSGPISPFATVLCSNIWCSPCYTARGGPADCRFFTTQCMKDILPEQVLTVIHQKLSHDTIGLDSSIIKDTLHKPVIGS
jgi:lipopolysaccharide heptosyltransferase II